MRAYRLLTTLLSPLVEALLLRRRRQGVPLKISGCDFFASKKTPENPEKRPFSAPKRPIWLHCASAGEVVAAQPLIETLLAESRPLVVTLWSPNGAIKLNQLFGDTVPACWLPWDSAANMRRLINQLQPAELWVMETEIWPNMLLATAQANVPITYVNGRLTEKTLRAPRWLKAAYAQGLRQVDKVLARGEQDAERFAQLGVPPERIHIAGNLKWLAAARLIDNSPQPLRTRPYVLFASAYVEETEALFNLLQEQKLNLPWVIVPRRPRDADIMAQQAKDHDFSPVLIHKDTQAETEQAQVLIETRFGNLTRWMAGAEVVIMGGSFAPYGGHNFLEACALGKPVIVGPDMGDFAEETRLFLNHHAIIQTDSLDSALQILGCPPVPRSVSAAQHLHDHAMKIMNNYTLHLNLSKKAARNTAHGHH